MCTWNTGYICVKNNYLDEGSVHTTYRNVWPDVPMLLPWAVISVATLSGILRWLLGSVDWLGEVPGADVPLRLASRRPDRGADVLLLAPHRSEQGATQGVGLRWLDPTTLGREPCLPVSRAHSLRIPTCRHARSDLADGLGLILIMDPENDMGVDRSVPCVMEVGGEGGEVHTLLA